MSNSASEKNEQIGHAEEEGVVMTFVPEKNKKPSAYRSGLSPALALSQKVGKVIKQAHEEKLKIFVFWDFYRALRDEKVLNQECSKSNIAMPIKYFVSSHVGQEIFKLAGKNVKSCPNIFPIMYIMKRIWMGAENIYEFFSAKDPSLLNMELHTRYFSPKSDKDIIKLMKSQIEAGINSAFQE